MCTTERAENTTVVVRLKVKSIITSTSMMSNWLQLAQNVHTMDKGKLPSKKENDVKLATTAMVK